MTDVERRISNTLQAEDLRIGAGNLQLSQILDWSKEYVAQLQARLGLSSIVAAGDRLLVHLKSSYSAACPGNNQTATTSSSAPVKEPQQVERHNFPEREDKQLEFEAGLGFRIFRVWRINVTF